MSELVWAYCVIPASAAVPTELAERVEHGPLALLVSRVPRSEYTADALQENLNDLEWLERVARAHEAVLDEVLERSAMVPLRLCTIYETEDSARQMLAEERDSLNDALERVTGCQEWSLKLLIDPDKLKTAARDSDPEVAAMDAEADAPSEAAAYLVRRRQERRLRSVCNRLVAEVAYDLEGSL